MGISYRRGTPAEPEGRVVKPTMTCTTSLPFRNDKSSVQLATYANEYGHRTSRTCKEGDWILYEFDEPLEDVVVELTTGYRHVARGVFPTGVVEISVDGKEFREECALKGGLATLTLSEPTRAIRLRCTRTGNGDSFVYIQHPIIRRVEN
jgi:hexosaminidase